MVVFDHAIGARRRAHSFLAIVLKIKMPARLRRARRATNSQGVTGKYCRPLPDKGLRKPIHADFARRYRRRAWRERLAARGLGCGPLRRKRRETGDGRTAY